MRADILCCRALRRVAAPLLLWVVGGCSAETPPYDELPLRDALSAAPEALASMPERSRRDVALRLEEAHRAGEDEIAVASSDVHTMAALVRNADATREEENKDAIVLGALEPASQGIVLRSLAAGDPPETPFEIPSLSGPAAQSTAPLEEAALHGRAGAILAGLADRAGARDLVRVTGLPVGVVAMDHTVYVNGSWLVALSVLEPLGAPSPSPSPSPRGAEVLRTAPPLEPSSVRFNPYNLPDSIAECAVDVRETCSCAEAAQCDHEPTDPTFSSGQEECAWVNAEPARAEALCVLALMSIEGVKECVQSAGAACGQRFVANREGAVLFVADVGCLDALDNCLNYGRPTAPSSGSQSTSSSAGCGSCDQCDKDTDGCNQNCSKCNENCSDCNDNCSDCNQNQKDCNDNCKSSAVYSGPATCRLSAGRRAPLGGRSGGPPVGAAHW